MHLKGAHSIAYHTVGQHNTLRARLLKHAVHGHRPEPNLQQNRIRSTCYLTRRVATAAPLIRSSPGRRVAVGRLPGKRRERGRFLGETKGADTIRDAGRHYKDVDDVRA